MASTPPPGGGPLGGDGGEFRDLNDTAACCAAIIAPGVRCGHHVAQHEIHGSAFLECWRCEDWHHFVPSRPADLDRRDAA